MNDCPNSGVRDRLPDLLHDRLDAATRAMVQGHVDLCADCRAELALLRGIHGMLVMRTPKVDLEFIVQALPKAPGPTVTQALGHRRRVWSDWRVAAAVTLLVAGGGSVVILHRAPTTAALIDSVPPIMVSQPTAPARAQAPIASSTTESLNASANALAARSATTTVNAATTQAVAASDEGDAAAVGVEATARLGDLDAQQLKALLGQIGNLRAVPVADPDPVTIRVNPSGDLPNGSSL